MRSVVWLIILALFLYFFVPLSSKAPDAVQRVLHLPGETESIYKALGGAFVVLVMVVAVLTSLKKIK